MVFTMKDAKNFDKLFVNSRVVKKRRINVFNVFGFTFTYLYTIVVFTILPHLVTVAFAYTDCTFLVLKFAYTDCTFLVLKFAYTITLLILASRSCGAKMVQTT